MNSRRACYYPTTDFSSLVGHAIASSADQKGEQMTALMIRITPKEFEPWKEAHFGSESLRAEYGITEGPFYRDDDNPGTALVTLYVEDLDRAMEWFKSEEFKGVNERGNYPDREFWVAEKRD